jgi:glutathione S-transferase
MMKLYQFPFSHYCEKSRWVLEYKRVPYEPVNFLPGLHFNAVRRVAPNTCLPVLLHEKTVIQGSSAIITYVDATFPTPALTPGDPAAAREALEWEEYLDEQIGVNLRLWFYYHTLPHRERALRFLLRDAPWHRSVLFRLIFPRVRPAMMRFMKINADTAKQAEVQLLAALEKLDQALKGRRFLVGESFSRADLTACALLSPCCMLEDKEAAFLLSKPVLESRNAFKDRRFYAWVRSVYDSHRQFHPAGLPAAA